MKELIAKQKLRQNYSFGYDNIISGGVILFRVKNIYAWKTISDWYYAYSNSLFQFYHIDELGFIDNGTITHMIEYQILPIFIICEKSNYKKTAKLLVYDVNGLLNYFIGVINNKYSILVDNKRYYFTQLSEEYKNKIRSLDVTSYWLRSENMDDINLIMGFFDLL